MPWRPGCAPLASACRVIDPDAILITPESAPQVRSASRDRAHDAPDVAGLYPCGEGGGYAGGILSAALDGMRVAEAVARHKKATRKGGFVRWPQGVASKNFIIGLPKPCLHSTAHPMRLPPRVHQFTVEFTNDEGLGKSSLLHHVQLDLGILKGVKGFVTNAIAGLIEFLLTSPRRKKA